MDFLIFNVILKCAIVAENNCFWGINYAFVFPWPRSLANKLTDTMITREPIQKCTVGTFCQNSQSQMLEKITPVNAKGVMTFAGAYLNARVSKSWKIKPKPPTNKSMNKPCAVGSVHCAIKNNGNKIAPSKWK